MMRPALVTFAQLLALCAMVSSFRVNPRLHAPKLHQRASRRQSLVPRMFSPDFIATAGADLIAPTVLVSSGVYVLGMEGEEAEEDEADSVGDGEEKEVDIYRDTALRYMGYANEVGEAFGPIVPAWIVPFSYVVGES